MLDGVTASRLIELQESLTEFRNEAARTGRLDTAAGLRCLGLWSPVAEREDWFHADHDPRTRTRCVRNNLVRHQPVCYLLRQHRLALITLVVNLLLLILAAVILAPIIPPQNVSKLAGFVGAPLVSALLLAPFIVRGGRNELTFAIRLAALRLAILEACASGLDKLRGRQEVRESTQVLLVGRWQVYRTAPRTCVNPVQAPLVVRTGGARLLWASIVVLFRWLWRS